MNTNNNSFNPKLIPGIIFFFLADVLLIVQIVLHKDFLIKYNTKCVIIICLVSFVLSLIGNLFEKKKHEKKCFLVFTFVFTLFYVLLFINFKVVYGILWQWQGFFTKLERWIMTLTILLKLFGSILVVFFVTLFLFICRVFVRGSDFKTNLVCSCIFFTVFCILISVDCCKNL